MRRSPTLQLGLALALGCCLALAPLVGCRDGGDGGDRGPLRGRHLLVTLIDACAIDHLELYGYERNTMPFLSHLAREGIVFEDVTAPAPYTIASVASLLSGEAVDVHGVTEAGRELSPELDLLAERFARIGYRTSGLSANAHIQRNFGFARGFESFHGFWPDIGEEHRVPHDQLAKAREVLEAAAEDSRSLFAYWHFLPPHAPYDPPAADRVTFAGHLAGTPLDEAGGLDNLMPLSHGVREPGEAERQAIEDLYDASLRHVDAQLEELHRELERTGLLEDTVWVVLSDHGEAFGQHGLWQHARTVYEEMVRVPMVVRLPEDLRARFPVGRRSTPVGLTDLVPTLVELFDLPGERPWSSHSLVSVLEADPPAGSEDRPPIITRTAGPAEHVAIRSGDLKLIHRLTGVDEDGRRKGPGTWELYDLSTDPWEQRRLPHGAPAHAEDVARLRGELRAFREGARERAREARDVGLDAETERRLEEIGYL